MLLEVGTLLEARKPGGHARRARWRAARVVAPAECGVDALVAVKFVGEAAVVKLRWADLKTAPACGGAALVRLARGGAARSADASSAEVIDLDADGSEGDRASVKEVGRGVKGGAAGGEGGRRVPAVVESAERRQVVGASFRDWLVGKGDGVAVDMGPQNAFKRAVRVANPPSLTAHPTTLPTGRPTGVVLPTEPLVLADVTLSRGAVQESSRKDPGRRGHFNAHPYRRSPSHTHDLSCRAVHPVSSNASSLQHKVQPDTCAVGPARSVDWLHSTRSQGLSATPTEGASVHQQVRQPPSSAASGAAVPILSSQRNAHRAVVSSDPTVVQDRRKAHRAQPKDVRIFDFAHAMGHRQGASTQTTHPFTEHDNLSFTYSQTRNHSGFEFTTGLSSAEHPSSTSLPDDNRARHLRRRRESFPSVSKRPRVASPYGVTAQDQCKVREAPVGGPPAAGIKDFQQARHPAQEAINIRIPRAKNRSTKKRASRVARDDLALVEEYIPLPSSTNYAPMRADVRNRHSQMQVGPFIAASQHLHRRLPAAAPVAPNFQRRRRFPFDGDTDESENEADADALAAVQDALKATSSIVSDSAARQEKNPGMSPSKQTARKGRKARARPSRWNILSFHATTAAAAVANDDLNNPQNDVGSQSDNPMPSSKESFTGIDGPHIVRCICETTTEPSQHFLDSMIRCAVCATWSHLACIQADKTAAGDDELLVSSFVCVVCAEYASSAVNRSHISNQSDVSWRCQARAVLGCGAPLPTNPLNMSALRTVIQRPRPPLQLHEIRAREQNVELLRSGFENLLSIGFRERSVIDSRVGRAEKQRQASK